MGRLRANLLPIVAIGLAAVLLYRLPTPEARAGELQESETVAQPDEVIPPIPINFDVVEKDGQPIAGIDWVAPQLADATEHYSPFGLRFAVVAFRHHPGQARIETRHDRDGASYLYVRGAVNVFIVEALKDIDTTSTYERGVAWGDEQDHSKKYIFIQAGSPPGVLTHEMGHILGLPHSHEVDNVMSYQRTHTRSPFFRASQGAIMRSYAKRYFASRWLYEPSADKIVQ